MMQKAQDYYIQGYEAFDPIIDPKNPYVEFSAAAEEWQKGWKSAKHCWIKGKDLRSTPHFSD